MPDQQSGRGEMGSRKHGKSGTPGHNRDAHELVRDINRSQEETRALKRRQKPEMKDSIQELFQKPRAKKPKKN